MEKHYLPQTSIRILLGKLDLKQQQWSPSLTLHVCTRNHGLVPHATRVERKKRHLAKPRREEQCTRLAALHCPRLAGGACLLPSPPVTRGKGRAGPQGPALHAVSTPGVIYSPWGSDRGHGCEWEGDSDQMSAGPFQTSPHKCAAQLATGAALCQTTVVTRGPM